MATTEISRTDITQGFDTAYEFECLGCGVKLTLWYNGGELDQKRHCGYIYDLESPVTEFVVRKQASGDH